MEARKKRRWPYVLGGIFAVLVLGVAIVLWRLDAILLQQARAQAATFSQQLGRPIQIGDISTKLFPHIGVDVENVSVGAAEGEDLPLAEVKALDVRVAAMPLLRSSGKDIQVLNAEVTGLTVNVIRLPDGTTNVQRLQERLASQQKPEEEAPPENTPPTDLSGVRVDRAALTDGTIRFVDRSGAKAQELAVSDLDIEVKDLRVGQPLEVKLAAAVLAQKQNLFVTLSASPLPPTLVPTPERLSLKAEAIDLAPLGPFLPPSVGFQAGTLTADWKAELGAAIPGGKGPTRLEGAIRALGLKFAGAEGGKALDVVLDTDVKADLAAGDLALDRFKLDFGPAGIDGKGRVKGMHGSTPSVEGFELTSHDLDPAVLSDYYPPLKKMLGGMIAGPVGLSVKGSGTQEAQALEAEVDLTPVRLRIPAQLSKEAGAAMRLTARLAGAAASGGALRFDAKANLAGVDMRPGLVLNKAPGQRLDAAVAGTYQPTQDGMKVNVSQLTLNVLADTLTGTATAALAGQGKKQTTTFALDMKSPRIDADALLMPEEEVLARTGGKEEPPSDDATRFNGYRGDMKFQVGAVRYSQMDLSNIVAHVTMVDDLIQVEKLTTGIYGGSVVADGTSIRLGPLPEQRPFEAKVKVQGVEMGSALSAFTPKKVMTGTFNGNVDVKGVGYTPGQLKQTLLGAINGNVANGSLLGLDIISSVTEPLAKALPFAAKALRSGDVTSLGENLPFGVEIKNGVAQLDKPITWSRPEGAMNFTGGIRLDGELDLSGTVNLAPQTIQTLTLGKAKPTEAIPVTLNLTGPAWSPKVTGLDVKPAATAIAKQVVGGLAGQLLGDKAKPVQDLITGGGQAAREEAERQKQALEQKAAEEKARLDAAARAKQEEAKKKAEEEAKKRLRGVFGK
ncbi:AsmA family protein [Stigmatella aurantiaca]|uniref:AsmA family n=1 Tax=Stigmatella aurantiaca (strain DW4/3-1) TaxID=378806 RepID=Q09AK0_STIAD|nr:AsmA family protein [Stigmatella aurantiaca]ADO68050.1 AsmA family protein [Stigmatella aurantiaca DW4/3-1]EAU68762.1 AsmA family [Stigmatella aurantiaca DW4/3-1]